MAQGGSDLPFVCLWSLVLLLILFFLLIQIPFGRDSSDFFLAFNIYEMWMKTILFFVLLSPILFILFIFSCVEKNPVSRVPDRTNFERTVYCFNIYLLLHCL